jgi:leader peptidase (prepilin peptidase)/N-methyltransferase
MQQRKVQVKGMLTTAMAVIVFLFGLLIGSFLNVCIYRIPLRKTVVKGRSYCPSCNSLIPWYCNIPLFSFLFLKGRCKDCGEKISLVYPIVELLNALLYLTVWQIYGLTFTALFTAILFSILVVISFIDLAHQIIPDGLVLVIFILGIANAVYQTVTFGVPWYTFVIGFFAASVPLFILGLIYPDGMGGGDIKLMAASGLFMGWKLILLSLFIGALYGAIVSIFIIARKKGSMKSAIPFGPMLSLGIVTCALAGEKILFWYLSLFI